MRRSTWRYSLAAVVMGAGLVLTACAPAAPSPTAAPAKPAETKPAAEPAKPADAKPAAPPAAQPADKAPAAAKPAETKPAEAAKPATGEPIKIGAPQTLTGPNALFGEEDKRVADMFLEEFNAKGGVNGRPLELVYVDTGGKPDAAAAAAERLVARDKVPMLLMETGGSSVTIQVSRIAQQNKIPHLVHTAAALDLTGSNWEWVFRLNPMVSHYNDALVDFLLNQAKPKSIYHVHENSLFGQGSNSSLKAWAEAQKIDYRSDAFETGGVDFKPILSKVKSADPDLVYFTAYVADAVLLTRQSRELGLKPRMFATGGAGFIFPEWIQGTGKDSDYFFSATLWTPDVPYKGAKEFNAAFEKRYGKPATYEAAAAHALLQVTTDALKRAKAIEPAAIREALLATDMETVYGPVKFEAFEEGGRKFTNQNRQVPSLLMQVQDGRWTTVWPEKLASKKPVFPVPGLKQ